jgi:hypothetical protein
MTLSRRTALTTMAGGMALAGTGMAAGAADSDARLLELSAELDAAWAVAWPLHEPAAAAEKLASAELERRCGDWPSPTTSAAAAQAWWKTYREIWQEFGAAALAAQSHAAWEKCDAIHERIMATRASSVLGFGLQARALAMNTSLIEWDKPLVELDWGEKCTRRLIEGLVHAAGLELPAALFAGRAEEAAELSADLAAEGAKVPSYDALAREFNVPAADLARA